MPRWVHAVDVEAMADGARRLVRAAGREIALFRVHGHFHALEDRCPHGGASLVTGRLEGTALACPAHGLRFDLATGCMRGGPLRAQAVPVRVHGGRVEVDVEVDVDDAAR